MGIKMWRSSSMKTIQLGQRNSQNNSSSRWRMIWNKFIKREKKKVFLSTGTWKASYDPYDYSQNFDHGMGWAEPDNVYRSFSARYANPSRILPNNLMDC
ncbi:hypothetical protein Ddye_007694 [Dipteronia dyeriana]|uniref:Uncharacterized protein n=1 Tax=Dipteronia dyeriana TaxID=168575 RepID=A0AAD9XKX9_9ROSI|nr:hypothetical protein Ddye_007694 [Dipteronia dyeriana]